MVGNKPDSNKTKDKKIDKSDQESTNIAQDRIDNEKLKKIVTLKPPSTKDDPKPSKKNKNKNTKKDKNYEEQKDDTKTRKISDMFEKKSITKDKEKIETKSIVQRQEASKEGKSVSSSQLDYDYERVPLDGVGRTRNFNNIPDSIIEANSAVKPDLAKIKRENNFPVNNLGESSSQISESQRD